MALFENKDELKISKIEDLFSNNLEIPEYQRPYRWGVESVNTFFNDIYNAFDKNMQEYRLGSVILHKKTGTDIYNIVDGQQRITSLAILFYALNPEEESIKKIFKKKYSSLSTAAILSNHEIFKKRIKDLGTKNDAFKEYILKKCTVVQIVTNEEQEAFQFFDSQNTRGKRLEPHDLLKAYHLREMSNESEIEKIEIIEKWENLKPNDLKDLFEYHLYPLTKWYKGKSGLGYSSSKIHYFKGIKEKNSFNYAVYHKGSNFFVEQLDSMSINRLLNLKLNQFQLTQPLIAGKRFFYYIFHYSELLEEIKKRIEKHKDFQPINDCLPDKKVGDTYVKNLFLSSLLFFTDHFGIDSLNDSVIKHLYTWSYSLRLVMSSVYRESINKYARGLHERINEGINIFEKISEMISPEELELILLDEIPKDEKYKCIYNKIAKFNGWNGGQNEK